MKTSRFFRTAGLRAFLSFLFFCSPVHSQQRPAGCPRFRFFETWVLLLPVAAVPTPQATPQPSAEEKLLFDAANRERAAAGIPSLAWDSALAAAARQHALLMAQEHLLSHQYPDEPTIAERAARAGAKFSKIAENVAMGADPESIHFGWMHSPGHRKNILSPDLVAVGIATVRGSGGLFAVQDFSRPVADLTLAQQEERVISLLKKSGLRHAQATDDARKACRTSGSYAGPSVRYLIHFEVVDLKQLPEDLLRHLKDESYATASVGACTSDDSAAFSRYRIAVLLE